MSLVYTVGLQDGSETEAELFNQLVCVYYWGMQGNLC